MCETFNKPIEAAPKKPLPSSGSTNIERLTNALADVLIYAGKTDLLMKILSDPSADNINSLALSDATGDLQLALCFYSDTLRPIELYRKLGKRDADVKPWEYEAERTSKMFERLGAKCELIG